MQMKKAQKSPWATDRSHAHGWSVKPTESKGATSLRVNTGLTVLKLGPRMKLEEKLQGVIKQTPLHLSKCPHYGGIIATPNA